VAQNPMISMYIEILHTLSMVYIYHKWVTMRLLVYLLKLGSIEKDKNNIYVHICQLCIGL
jgi:hypothetical protein